MGSEEISIYRRGEGQGGGGGGGSFSVLVLIFCGFRQAD